MQDNTGTVSEQQNLPHVFPTVQQTTSASSRSLNVDPTSARYHVISTPRDSDCESGIVHSSLQLNVSGTSRSVADASSGPGNERQRSEERRRRIRYRNRRNRIGLLLVFATLLLFAGLVICANTKEYVAGATISVIGVILGSSSMVLCLLTTDSCERVHGFRERVSSYSTRRRSAGGNASTDNQRTHVRHADDVSRTISIANSTVVHDSIALHNLPPTAVCNISGDFLDHLPPPSYETAEILRREDMVAETSQGGNILGAVGGSSDYQYYKVSQTEDSTDTRASSSTNLASTSVATVATSHMCEECVQRQQQNMDAHVGAAGTSHIHEEQLLLAPAIVVELPTYDEAIAEDR